jgi:hypothetical protein
VGGSLVKGTVKTGAKVVGKFVAKEAEQPVWRKYAAQPSSVGYLCRVLFGFHSMGRQYRFINSICFVSCCTSTLRTHPSRILAQVGRAKAIG